MLDPSHPPLATFSHEARHAFDRMNGLPLEARWSEFRAFVEETVTLTGKAPTREQMGRLARSLIDHSIYGNYPGHVTDSRITRIAENY
jgi:hypothetical protein